MAYQSGVANSLPDFFDALQQFAAAEGWTVDIYSAANSWMALNNGSCYVQFRWDSVGTFAGFHSTGFVNNSTAPGNHTGDDGCGQLDSTAPYNSTVTSGRRAVLGTPGPYTGYHFFTDDTTQYIHCVLEVSPGVYNHLSFGTIDKIGTWTGGQYFGLQNGKNQPLSAYIPSNTGTSGANEMNSLRVDGLSNQTAGSVWSLFTGRTTTPGVDRAGNARVLNPGGWKGYNPWQAGFGMVRSSPVSGYVPLIPVPVWWRDSSDYYLLGFGPKVFTMNMANFAPQEEFTIGLNTYKVFPMVQKAESVDSSNTLSGYGGVAYLKVI